MTTKKTKAKGPLAKKAKSVSAAKQKKTAKPVKSAARAAVKKSQGKSVPVKKKTQVQVKKPVPAKTQAKKTPVVRKVEVKKATTSTPEKKVVPKKVEAVVRPSPEKVNGKAAPVKKPEPGKLQAVKPPAKPMLPARKGDSHTNGAARSGLPRSMTMASTPVRPPVVAVPGQPAIVVKPAPSPPLLGGPRPSAAGESAKLATLIRASGFATGDHVVYPTHGVGRIVETETQTIAGQDLHLFVITFEKDRMTLRLPIAKVRTSGLRKLATRKEMLAALTRLKGRSRARRTMWSRRAQEYEAKINSGDPNSIAEVVRDLYRNAGQPDQSYSERQIYQAALDRLAREFAVIEKIDEQTAAQRLEQMLRAA
jgi:CarD family transcriptional regulator